MNILSVSQVLGISQFKRSLWKFLYILAVLEHCMWPYLNYCYWIVRQCISRKFLYFWLFRNSGIPEFRRSDMIRKIFIATETQKFRETGTETTKNSGNFVSFQNFRYKVQNFRNFRNVLPNALRYFQDFWKYRSKKPKSFPFMSHFWPHLGLFEVKFSYLFSVFSEQTKFQTSLPEQKYTGNSGQKFLGSGSHFPENTPDFKIVTGTHCLTELIKLTCVKYGDAKCIVDAHCNQKKLK